MPDQLDGREIDGVLLVALWFRRISRRRQRQVTPTEVLALLTFAIEFMFALAADARRVQTHLFEPQSEQVPRLWHLHPVHQAIWPPGFAHTRVGILEETRHRFDGAFWRRRPVCSSWARG